MNFINLKKITNCFGGDIKVLRDWKLALTFFLVFLIIVCLIDGYTFWKYQRELSQEVGAERISFVAIDRTSLQNIIDGLNIKEREFNKNLVAPKVNDPSL